MSLQQLLDAAREGDTIKVPPGTYAESLRIRQRRVCVQAAEPGTVYLTGAQQRIERTATGSGFCGIRVQGSEVGPLIYADYGYLYNCEVTNGNKAIGVHATNYYDDPPPDGIQIVGCRIHHCGALPATNYDHGIYLGQATNTLIQRNWIHDNADRGVQMYPGCYGTKVLENVIDSNGQGVIFGGHESQASGGNLVARNVISNSKIRFNIESSFAPSKIPTGNVAEDNMVWTETTGYYGGNPLNSGIESPVIGFISRGNIVAKPNYRNQAKRNYTIAGRPETRIAKWLR